MAITKARKKTIRLDDLTNLKMSGGGEDSVDAVIISGTVHRWVGIGWVEEGPATSKQKQTLPRVVGV